MLSKGFSFNLLLILFIICQARVYFIASIFGLYMFCPVRLGSPLRYLYCKGHKSGPAGAILDLFPYAIGRYCSSRPVFAIESFRSESRALCNEVRYRLLRSVLANTERVVNQFEPVKVLPEPAVPR